MDTLTRDELKKLAGKSDGDCVSIYMPTFKAGRETEQNPIRLKNLLRLAEERLLLHGVDAEQIRYLLKPGADLLDDRLFWQNQSDGLALFFSPDGMLYYRLPLHFGEYVGAAKRFHVLPLLPLVSVDGQFFVLALSQNEVRLLNCTRYSVREVRSRLLDIDFAKVLHLDEPERQVHLHTGAPVGRGSPAAVFHGDGSGLDEAKTDLLRYFQEVDKGVQELLRDVHAPLLIAAVDYLVPLYREVSKYPYHHDGAIEGNPENLREEELQSRAWEIVHPIFDRVRLDALDRYRMLASSTDDLTATYLRKIIMAACEGRVETLFVSEGTRQWGICDPEAMTIQVHDELQPGDDELVDYAAAQTFLKGGAVYILEPEEMPAEAPVAATFRY